MPKKHDNPWASAKTLADVTGAGRQYIRQWCEADAVPMQQHGRRVLFDRSRALDAIRAHQRAPTDSTPPFKLDMALLGYTLEHYVEHSKLCVRMIGVLADAAAATSEAVAQGDFVGLDEDQAKRLLAMLGEPLAAAKRLLPADLLEAAEKEGA